MDDIISWVIVVIHFVETVLSSSCLDEGDAPGSGFESHDDEGGVDGVGVGAGVGIVGVGVGICVDVVVAPLECGPGRDCFPLIWEWEGASGGSASVGGELVANRDPALELVVRVFWRWIRSDGRVVVTAVVTVAVRDVDVDMDDDNRFSGDVGEEVVGLVVDDDIVVVVDIDDVVADAGNRKGDEKDDDEDEDETWMVVPRASTLL